MFSFLSFPFFLLILLLTFCHSLFRADPFSKKDWYDVKAPSVFNTRNVGKTLVTRTQGTKVCFEKNKHDSRVLLKSD